MSFTVIFKKNKSEKNKIGKVFDATTLEVSCNLLDVCSVQTPTLRIKTTQDLFDYNYCHISQFHRDYFIEKIEILRDNLFQVYLRCDVLETWANEIKANTAIVKRQEEKYNLYLTDDLFKSYNYEQIQTKEFLSGFSKNLNYVLICNGK